jgi:hypothetical protein
MIGLKRFILKRLADKYRKADPKITTISDWTVVWWKTPIFPTSYCERDSNAMVVSA